MSDPDSIYQRSLYLSPGQQDLLFAALASSNHFSKDQDGATMMNPGNPGNLGDPNAQQSPQHSHRNGSSGPELFDSASDGAVGSTRHGVGTDESPFLDFDLDPEFDFNGNGDMIGDLPESYAGNDDSEAREKRKSMDKQDDTESGKKRKENDDKIAKKPGRKPLMSEPTSKRKAQNRAAQRAFRDRKEKHLKDLESKVEGLEKASQAVNNENSMLRSQVDRLQLELKEYRKRLSWVSGGNSISQKSNPLDRTANGQNRSRLSNEFTFEFPKFGDLSGSQRFGNGGSLAKTQKSNSPMPAQYAIPGNMGRDSANGSNLGRSLSGYGSTAAPPATNGQRAGQSKLNNATNVDMQGLYEFLTASNNRNMVQPTQHGLGAHSKANYNPTETSTNYPFPNLGASDSPSASSESQHGHMSSIGTSPEPMPNSPQQGKNNNSPQTQNAENPQDEYQQAFYTKLSEACGCPENPVPAALSGQNPQPNSPQQQTSTDNGFDWLAQQNGGQFDPALFGDYRESQDAVLSQDFGSFFDDAFPFQGFDLSNNAPPSAPKPALIDQIDSVLAANDQEVVPAEDRSKMLSCPRIWDRLQSMEKFRNGEIDVDNLCTELKTKARCSEGGVVVNQNDVEEIMTRAK